MTGLEVKLKKALDSIEQRKAAMQDNHTAILEIVDQNKDHERCIALLGGQAQELKIQIENEKYKDVKPFTFRDIFKLFGGWK